MRAAVLSAFIAQFYDDKPPPPCVLVNHPLAEQELVAEALSLKARAEGDGRCVRSAARSGPSCSTPSQRCARRWSASSRNPPARRSCWRASPLFRLPGPPERIEVYDNSHIMGANPYGVMIVGGRTGS